MSEPIELKPCPFCGQPVEVKAKYIQDSELYTSRHEWIECTGCMRDFWPVDEWNTRPLEDVLSSRVAKLEAVKDGAYHERNQVVAALSKVFPATLQPHTGEDWGPDWQWVCFIDLPTGQVSWHIHSGELALFDHLKRTTANKWDGHTTEEKYARLNALGRMLK